MTLSDVEARKNREHEVQQRKGRQNPGVTRGTNSAAGHEDDSTQDQQEQSQRPLQQDHDRVVKLPPSRARDTSEEERRLPGAVVANQRPEAFDVLSRGHQDVEIHIGMDGLHNVLPPVGKRGNQRSVVNTEPGHVEEIPPPDDHQCDEKNRHRSSPAPHSGIDRSSFRAGHQDPTEAEEEHHDG